MPLLQDIAPEAQDLQLSDITVGDSVRFDWTAKVGMIDAFADISGDRNPLHMDAGYAENNGFEGRIVHGFLLGAQVSGLIGMVLPGRRCMLLEEKLSFHLPVYADDQIVFHGTVKDVHEELLVITVKVSATKDDSTVMKGTITCRLLS